MTRGRKKSNNSKDVVLNVRINKKLNETLKSFCVASSISKSEAVRIILESFLNS